MKRLGWLLILLVAASLLLPLNVVVEAEDNKTIGTKVVLDNNAEAVYLGDDLWEATIGGPKYLDDLVTPIEARWHYDIDKNEWNAGANLFDALVKDSKVTVWYENQSLSWQPDVFIGTKKQAVNIEQLLINDPINENYFGNTLQWYYGDITRNVRIIEGMLIEYYTIPSLPTDDILIISHSEKDAGFVWKRPIEAWDNDGKPVNITVDGDDLTVTLEEMEGAAFPITIDPVFTSTAKDGYVWAYDTNWNTVRTQAVGDYAYSTTGGSTEAVTAASSAGVYYISRAFFYFDTSALPNTCTITSATLGIRGYGNGGAVVLVQQGTQAATLTTADYNNFAGGQLGIATSWSTSSYNNISISTAVVSKTATTKLCLREAYRDFSGPAPGASYKSGCYFYEMGIGYWPLLTVIYAATGPPAITTNAATYITATTARLNSYVTDDGSGGGGELADVRFQYGNFSGEAGDNYTVNSSWINDTYATGDSPYLDIVNLTVNTTYYFRAQIRNSNATVNGSELNFTAAAVIGAPTNLTAYPSCRSVSLTWIKGTGSTNTMIRGQVGAYPVNYTNGTQIYFGSMSTATHTGLSPGTTWYYRAWGESGGNYSATYNETFTTTPACGAADTDPGAPTMPGAWYGAPDHTRLAGVPFYSMVNDLADGYGMPPTNLWLLLFVFAATLIGLAVYAISHSAVGSIMAGGVALVILLNSLGGLLWIVFAVCIIATGIFMAVRRT